MKSFLILSIFLLLFTGCSSKNAFDQFDMDEKQELTVSNLQSTKLVSKDGDVTGIVSVVYLNEVYPYYFSGKEYFFVYMYLKDSKNTELSMTMNGEAPLKLKKLSKINNFTHLVDVKSDWNKYYLATFANSGDDINLVFESDQSSSVVLKYQKDLE
ncbi:hypothetical protein [Sulfurimonas sp.]|uniref:hypothetical protein n=1 Tax=Sulfurimonas sp. TaxID=2022749 RepID=UPI00261A3E59|nr:hypothetical protein [Sulfurimonas sp.]MCW8895168.1 hypothetical protein [Sulfurimonas sp.]MCW9067751.1 hypothetical protein [Sulfurimonas sp.]